MEEGLEIAHRRRQPGSLFDLEDELTRGWPVRTRTNDEDGPGVGELRRDRLGARLVAGAPCQQRPDVAGIDRSRGEMGPDRGRRDQWRDIADRVAPAVVELDRLDHGLCQLGPRRAAACGDQGGPRATGGRSRKGPVRRGGSAFMRHADHEPGCRRIEGQLVCLGGQNRSRSGRQSRTAERVAEDVDDTLGGVLARPAAGDDDRRAVACRLADLAGQPPCRALWIHKPVEDSDREIRLGRDHLGHVVRGPVSQRRLGAGVPGVGRGIEWRGRIEGGCIHRARVYDADSRA